MYLYNATSNYIPLPKEVYRITTNEKGFTILEPVMLFPKSVTYVDDTAELQSCVMSGILKHLLAKKAVRILEANDPLIRPDTPEVKAAEYIPVEEKQEAPQVSSNVDVKLDMLIGAVSQLAAVLAESKKPEVKVKGKRGRPKGSKNVKNR